MSGKRVSTTQATLAPAAIAGAATKCGTAAVAAVVACGLFVAETGSVDLPRSLIFLNDDQHLYLVLLLTAALVAHDALDNLLSPAVVEETLISYTRPYPRLRRLRRIVAYATLVVAVACVCWTVITFAAGFFGSMARTTSPVPKYALLFLSGLAIQILYDAPRRVRSSLTKIAADHGTVEYLTRDQEVSARGDSVRDLKDGDRMLLITTQKLRRGMVEGTDYVDEDFMKFWFREVSERNLHLDQIVLISGTQDLRDFEVRVRKFGEVPNVRIGYLLAPPSTIYADIFTVPGRHVLLSFSNDAARRNLATYGLRLTGQRTVDSFVQLHDQVFSREASWVKTFEGVNEDELRALQTRLASIGEELDCTDALKSLHLFEVLEVEESG